MKILLSSAATLVLAHTALAEVKVTVGEISDKRTNGKFFAGLELKLNLSGPELAQAKGIRTAVKSATDDTGKALPEKQDKFSSGGFEELQKAFSSGFSSDKKADEFEVKLEFGNPPRAAKAIKALSGTIELLIPQKDPAAVITASFAKDAGKLLDNAALKAAGVELTLKAPGGKAKDTGGFGGGGENDLGYDIKDPQGKVASVEFYDAKGGKLESNGRMSSGFGGARSVSYSFSAKPPGDAIAKFYVVTEKSVVRVPLELKDVVLP